LQDSASDISRKDLRTDDVFEKNTVLLEKNFSCFSAEKESDPSFAPCHTLALRLAIDVTVPERRPYS